MCTWRDSNPHAEAAEPKSAVSAIPPQVRLFPQLVAMTVEDLHLVRKRLGFREGGIFRDFLKFLKHGALLTIKVRRNLDYDAGGKITGITAAEIRNTLSTQTEKLTIRSARGDLQSRGAFRRRNLHLSAKRRGHWRDWDIDAEIKPIPLEYVTVTHAENHIKIAVAAAADTAGALASDPYT